MVRLFQPFAYNVHCRPFKAEKQKIASLIARRSPCSTRMVFFEEKIQDLVWKISMRNGTVWVQVVLFQFVLIQFVLIQSVLNQVVLIQFVLIQIVLIWPIKTNFVWITKCLNFNCLNWCELRQKPPARMGAMHAQLRWLAGPVCSQQARQAFFRRILASTTD